MLEVRLCSLRIVQDFDFGRPRVAFAGFGDRVVFAFIFAGEFLSGGLLFEASKTSRTLCSNASRVKGFARKEIFGLEVPCRTKGWSE